MNCSRRRKRLQSAAGAGSRRTPTSPKNRRADAETGTVQTNSSAVIRNPTPKTVRKTRAATGSETRIRTKDGPKIERGIETGTKTEKRREIGILTKTEKNEETKTKSGTKRENDRKRGKRKAKMERVAVARYVT